MKEKPVGKIKLKENIKIFLYVFLFQHLVFILVLGTENDWFMSSYLLALLSGLLLISPKLPIWANS